MRTIFIIMVLLSSVLYSEEPKIPEITTNGCKELLPYIQKDFNLRAQGKRDSNVFAAVLVHSFTTFKDDTNLFEQFKKIEYIGDKTFFDSAYNKIEFKPAYDKFKNLSACTINYDQTAKKWEIFAVDKERVRVVTDNPSSSGITDIYSVYLEYPNIVIGSYIVLLSDMDINHTDGLPRGRSFNFLTKYDSGDSRYYDRFYKISVPNHVKTHVKVHNNKASGLKNYTYRNYKKGNSTIHEFELKTASYLEEEKFMDLDNGFIPYVYLSTYESWEYLNSFFLKVYDKKISDAQELIKKELPKIAEMFNVKTSELKPSHAYYYVRDNFRYVYAHTGEGNFIPHDISVILRERSGDCKDKALLLLAMLRAIGYDAYPVKIRTTGLNNYDLDFPTLNFDHAIVAYKEQEGKKLIFLDPTSSYVPFPSLSLSDTRRNYFLISKDGPVLGQTPAVIDNLKQVHKNIVINEKGEGIVDANIKYYGLSYANESKAYRKVNSEQLIEAEKHIDGNSPEVLDLKIINLSNYKEPLEVIVKGRSKDVAEIINDMLILPKPFNFSRNSLGVKHRKTPMVWYEDELDFNSIYTYKIPKGYKVRNLPGEFNYNSQYMDLSCSYEKKEKDDAIIESVRIKYKDPVIQPNDFEKEKERLNKIFEYQNQRIVLERI